MKVITKFTVTLLLLLTICTILPSLSHDIQASSTVDPMCNGCPNEPDPSWCCGVCGIGCDDDIEIEQPKAVKLQVETFNHLQGEPSEETTDFSPIFKDIGTTQ